MKVEFHKKEEWFQFYDVNGNLIKRKTEIRFDPLTKETSRLVFDPGLALSPPDYSKEAVKTSGKNCPFCSENVLKLTPVLPKDIEESGRISRGEALLFPNLFPYSKHNGVVIFSGDHYVRLKEFSKTMVKDALMVGQTYIERVMAKDKQMKSASINWNYLPESGGSILHPHMHILVSEEPTNYQSRTNTFAKAFKKETGEDYFNSLYEVEKERGERWIGQRGKVVWMHAYAPKSHNDYIVVLPKVSSISEITEQDWLDFATSLTAIFSALDEQALASFNMILNFNEETDGISIHGRLIPRLTIGQLNTSDVNFFQALHHEPLSYKIPEEVAKIARGHFIRGL